MKTLMTFLLLALTVTAMPPTLAADPIALDLDHPSRTDAEKARDRHRLPGETLAFFGLRDDMRVIELFPGGGWYTKLLAPYLADNGTLYVAMGTDRVEKKLNEPGLDKVVPTGKVYGFEKTDAPGYIYAVERLDFEQTDVDMVLTFRNAHNLDAAARMTLNRAVFDALRPGGIYGIVDHTKRHMEGIKPRTWRRTDPVEIIKEAIDSGFEFVGYTDLHARPEDELIYDTRHDSLVNETDRYTLKFRKPAQ